MRARGGWVRRLGEPWGSGEQGLGGEGLGGSGMQLSRGRGGTGAREAVDSEGWS